MPFGKHAMMLHSDLLSLDTLRYNRPENSKKLINMINASHSRCLHCQQIEVDMARCSVADDDYKIGRDIILRLVCRNRQ